MYKVERQILNFSNSVDQFLVLKKEKIEFPYNSILKGLRDLMEAILLLLYNKQKNKDLDPSYVNKHQATTNSTVPRDVTFCKTLFNKLKSCSAH